MFKIPLNTFDKEDQEIMKKVNDILSVPESEQNSKDKKFIDYVKYIFSNDFIKPKFILPNRKKHKKAYQYLKNYIEILHILFQKNRNERATLYNTKSSNFGNQLFNLFSSLSTCMEKEVILTLVKMH